MTTETTTSPATTIENNEEQNATLVNLKDVMPTILHILPLVNRPFFPGQAIPLIMDANLWKETIDEVINSEQKMLGLVLLRSENPNEAEEKDFYEMGTACRIHRVSQSDDKLQIMVEGLQRFHADEWVKNTVVVHIMVI